MSRLLLDERIRGDGEHVRTWASIDGDHVEVNDDVAGRGKLSVGAIEKVMKHYGRPLDDSIRLEGEALDLGAGRRLRRLRHHAPVDATGRDYLVWEAPGEEPIAVLATSAALAMRYLARLVEVGPQETEG